MNTFIQLRTGLIITYDIGKEPFSELNNSDKIIYKAEYSLISLDNGFTWQSVKNLAYYEKDILARWTGHNPIKQ